MRKGKLINEARAIPESEAKTKTPSAVRTVKDGITRYKTNALDFAIIKNGSTINFYDYQTNNLIRDFTIGEAQKLLNAIKSEKATTSLEISGMNTKKEAMHALSENYENEIQFWYDTTSAEERAKSGKRFLLGRTTNVLRSIGAKDYNIYIGASKINKILTENESMTLDIINSAIRLLEEPILVMQSQTVEDSIVAFGEVYTEGNKPVMVSVLLNPKTKNGEILDYAVITSAYGRRNRNIQNLIDKSKIYYVCDEKNRTDNWLKALGLQLPSAITKYGSINSIPEISQKINTSSKKSAEIKEKSTNTEQKTAQKGKKVDVSIANELKAAGEFAKANVPEYAKLSVPNQRAVRKTIMQARAQGISDTDIITFARFSAKSGINLSFDKSKLVAGTDEKGNIKYSDGMYGGNNTIYVNKDAKRKYSSLLFHELTHFLFKVSPDKLTRSLLRKAVENMSENRRLEIVDAYKKFYGTNVDNIKLIDIINDEWFAHYTEDVMNDVDVFAFLDSKKPTLKEAIVRFFSKSANEYKGEEQLSSAARKYAVKYRKLFNQIAELNQQNISSATDTKSLTSINREKMHVKGERHAIVVLEDGKTYVEASRNVINGKTRAEQRKEITEFFSKLLNNKPSLDIHTIECDILTITKNETADKARDDYKSVGGKVSKLTDDEFRVKLNIESHIDEIAEISHKTSKFSEDSKNHSFAIDGFTYRKAYFKDFDGQYYEVTISVGHSGTVATVYNVGKIKEGVSPSAKIIAVVGSMPLGETPSDTIISENAEKSNTFDKKTSEIFTDSRQALPETANTELSDTGISEGKKRQIIADYTRSTVYSRKAFVDTLKSVPGGLDLKPTTFKKYVDRVWENANTLTSPKDKFDFAHDIAVQIVDSIIAEGMSENLNAVEARERLAYLRPSLALASAFN